jgi:ubiquinone/menaquinone biosynthesis C-methylase UbiE
MSKWYKRMFEAKLGEHWIQLSDLRKEQTEQHIAFLRDTLPTGLTLDHCCGPGRLSIPLSKDRSVVGLDLSRELLNRTKSRIDGIGAENLNLIRGDMRYLPFRSDLFDSAFNVWTSFGFFSEEENELVLNEIVRVTGVRGVFVMDIANPEFLIRKFQEKDWSEEKEFFLLEQRSCDWKTRRFWARWIFIDKSSGQVSEIDFDHRLYSFNELKCMFEERGLKITDVYGSFTKEEFDSGKSVRIIIVARK